MKSFRNNRILRLEGWTIDLFLAFFDLVGDDIRRMVEEIKAQGKMLGSLNSTFLDLIPKSDHPTTFGDFRHVSLCNMLYKIVAKVIAMRIENLLSNNISPEEFGFLKDKHIREVVGVTQEAIHSIKTRNQAAFILKIDLVKAYDKASWTFIQLMLLHLGFSNQATKWVMSCVNIPHFVMLINGVASNFLLFFQRPNPRGAPNPPTSFF